MSQFRCKNCKQLQFKHRVRGDKVEIEVKCYSCNTFNYFTVWLSSLLREQKKQKNDKKSDQYE